MDANEILRRLRADGRASYSAIARELGITRHEVAEVVAEAVRGEKIRFTATVSPTLLGQTRSAYLLIAVSGSASAVADELIRLPGPCFVSIITGEYAVDAEVRARDDRALRAIVNRIRSLPGVRRIHANVYDSIEVTIDSPLRPSPAGFVVDQVDLDLVRALERDGRAAYRELGLAAGISPAAARNRVARLVSHEIVKIVGMPIRSHHQGPSPIGLGVRARGDVEATVARLRTFSPEFIAITHGMFDVIATIASDSNDELIERLDRIRALPEVFEVVSWSHLRIVKEYYGPSGSTGSDL